MRHFDAKCTPAEVEPVAARLTAPLEPDNVKYMSRFIFGLAVSFILSRTATAQQVPGRDLLEFPLGTLAESPALTRQIAGGLWNPATATLAPTDNVNRCVRVGLGLHYARYGVAIAREDGAPGIGASNQFLLTSVFR
jgi:hypothetical protein